MGETKTSEMQTESCSKELPERCAEALPESCSEATKPEQAGSSAASAVDATEHDAKSSREQSDEDLVRDMIILEAQQLAAEREAYLASERLAGQLQERFLQEQNDATSGRGSVGTNSEADIASIRLAHLLQQSEEQRLVRRSRPGEGGARVAAALASIEASIEAPPEVGSDEYKRRLQEALRSRPLQPSVFTTITPPKNCREHKVVVVGDSGVGKTALLLRFVSDAYYDSGVSGTIGGTYLARCIDVDGNLLNLKIWDTAGQERFRSVVKMYYRGAVAAVLCCDLADPDSFSHLQMWADDVRLECGNTCLFAIALTKSDLQRPSAISDSQVAAFARSLGDSTRITETSAKTREGVDRLFLDLGRRLLREISAEQGASTAATRGLPKQPLAVGVASKCAC